MYNLNVDFYFTGVLTFPALTVTWCIVQYMCVIFLQAKVAIFISVYLTS